MNPETVVAEQGYSPNEVGRKLSEILAEQRMTNAEIGGIKERLATMVSEREIGLMRDNHLERRIEQMEKQDQERNREIAANRKWLIASVIVPALVLLSSPVIALLVSGAITAK